MKKDIAIALFIFICVVGGGYGIKTQIAKNSYSIKEELREEEKIPEPEPRETTKTKEEIYTSIFALKDKKLKTISPEENDIYQNFYSYYEKESLFYNMFQESYTYEEYMYIKQYHPLRENTEIFGLYLVTYSKCEVFHLVDRTSTFPIESYCTQE